MLTTAIAIASAIVVAAGLGIGEGMNADSTATFTGKQAPALSDVLINIIPRNPIQAMAELGLNLLVQLAGYVAVLIGVLLLHPFVTQQLLLFGLTRLSSRIFLKKVRNLQIFAFSTSSSNASIPVTLCTVTEKLGVKNTVASFSVPFGATINMDGTAIMQGVATVFIANMYGVEGVSA